MYLKPQIIGITILAAAMAGGCRPRPIITPNGSVRTHETDQALRAALEVMKNEVNEYVEPMYDLKMEFDSRNCICRYFVGDNFSSSSMAWTVSLREIDTETIEEYKEEHGTRVQMDTKENRNAIEYREASASAKFVNELNLYFYPQDQASAMLYVNALRIASGICSNE